MTEPSQVQVHPLVAMEEELLRAQALEAHYRNRNLYLAQTVKNFEAAQAADAAAPESTAKRGK